MTQERKEQLLCLLNLVIVIGESLNRQLEDITGFLKK